jgi:hypothetical protein
MCSINACMLLHCMLEVKNNKKALMSSSLVKLCLYYILTWRLGSIQHERAAEGYDNKMVGSLKLLPISKTFIQSTSPVKTK